MNPNPETTYPGEPFAKGASNATISAVIDGYQAPTTLTRAQRRQAQREVANPGVYTALAHEVSATVPGYPEKEGAPKTRFARQLIKGDFHDAGKPLKQAITAATYRALKSPVAHIGRKQLAKRLVGILNITKDEAFALVTKPEELKAALQGAGFSVTPVGQPAGNPSQPKNLWEIYPEPATETQNNQPQ